jgi:predicted RNA-binding protein with TRAM domain
MDSGDQPEHDVAETSRQGDGKAAVAEGDRHDGVPVTKDLPQALRAGLIIFL